MPAFWHWFVAAGTIVFIIWCVWLVSWSAKQGPADVADGMDFVSGLLRGLGLGHSRGRLSWSSSVHSFSTGICSSVTYLEGLVSRPGPLIYTSRLGPQIRYPLASIQVSRRL